jgi:hypothetical protein
VATTITISGTDRTALLLSGTLSFTEALGQRNTCSCTFFSPDGAWKPLRGQTVLLYHNTLGDIFGGYISAVAWRKIEGGGAGIFAECTCVSYEQMLDRRRCWSHIYQGNNYGEIVRDVIVNSMGTDGFSAALVADGGQIVLGPVIALFEIQEPRPTIREALDQLSVLAANGTDIYYWDVTPAKVVRAYKQGTYAAPFNITDGSLNGLLQSCRVSEDISGKANRVFVYLGKYLLASAVEVVTGDGSARSFDLAYPVGAPPTIMRGASTQTVGIDGVDTAQWYYTLESRQVRQDAGQTVLANLETIDVTYHGLDKITLAPLNDAADITAESTLQGDGGTGYFEGYIESNTISGAMDGADLAAAYLARTSAATVIVEGETYTEGLRAGQELTVTLSQLSINTTMLVESATMRDMGAGRLLWSFKAIDGPQRADWKKRLLGGGTGSGSIVGSGVAVSGGSGSAAVVTDVTLTAADTINSPGTPADGANWIVRVKQDATGGWAVTWGSGIALAPEITATMNSAASTMCIIGFVGIGGTWYPASTPILGVRIV